MKNAGIVVFVSLAAVVASVQDSLLSTREGRQGNIRRERQSVLEELDSISDELFRRRFRLTRPEFFELLDLIRYDIEPTHPDMAVRSSGSHIPAALKLCATLRYLAGGSYLDIAPLYRIAEGSFYNVVNETIVAINNRLHNINFPQHAATRSDHAAQLAEMAEDFSKISRHTLSGTVGALDGVVFKMQAPTAEEAKGSSASYFQRKGYFAFGMQGMCDARLRFRMISMRCAASTHDSTAFNSSTFSAFLQAGGLPEAYHIVMDEAYPCRGQILSPWKGRSLSAAKDNMNFFISLHRQVIERAFGVLVARWGILWRPLRVKLSMVPIIITVCCKLHNICMDRSGVKSAMPIFETSEPLDIYSPQDPHRTTPRMVPLFQAAALGAGYRSDLESSALRDRLTEEIAANPEAVRPKARMHMSRCRREIVDD